MTPPSKPRTLLAFVLLMVFTVGAASLWALGTLREGKDRLHQDQAGDLLLAQKLETHAERKISAGRGLLLTGEERFIAEILKARGLFLETLASLRKRIELEPGKRLIDGIERAEHEHYEAVERVARTLKARPLNQTVAELFATEVLPKHQEVVALIQELVTYKRNLLNEALAQSDRLAIRAYGVFLVISVLALLIIAGLSFLLVEGMRRDRTAREELAAANDQVRSANATLESRVRERTVELEAANRELESFSYSVSHDLRTPLRSMNGFSQVLLEQYAEKLDGRGGDYLRRISAATGRMGQLIDDFLSLARVTRVELARETVDLSALAEEAVQALRCKESSRTVEVLIQPGITAHGDRNLLRIAIENLIGNAWKFTSRRPNARIEFGVAERPEGRAFYVRDNGAGFDMAFAHKLFKPFERLHDEQDFPGTGVGLATLQRIVARHGGRVWVEGKVDAGATFYFNLQG